jgi:hypothetical protein
MPFRRLLASHKLPLVYVARIRVRRRAPPLPRDPIHRDKWSIGARAVRTVTTAPRRPVPRAGAIVKKAYEADPASDYLFNATSQSDRDRGKRTPITTRMLYNNVTKAFKAAGITNIKPHDSGTPLVRARYGTMAI